MALRACAESLKGFLERSTCKTTPCGLQLGTTCSLSSATILFKITKTVFEKIAFFDYILKNYKFMHRSVFHQVLTSFTYLHTVIADLLTTSPAGSYIHQAYNQTHDIIHLTLNPHISLAVISSPKIMK